jgi:hypothetical protein
MKRQTVRVLVLGRFEDRFAEVMSALERSNRIEIVGPDRMPDVVVELRHPDCWKKVPQGKRFPAVVVVPQLLTPCSEEQAFERHADDYVEDIRFLIDAICESHLERHAKSA